MCLVGVFGTCRPAWCRYFGCAAWAGTGSSSQVRLSRMRPVRVMATVDGRPKGGNAFFPGSRWRDRVVENSPPCMVDGHYDNVMQELRPE